MNIKEKKIVVYGLGVTGLSSLFALSMQGAKLYLIDSKSNEKISNTLEKIPEITCEIIDIPEKFNWNGVDYLLKSPGIKLDSYILRLAEGNKVEVVSDIELAYRMYGAKNFIAITGTNGKTTTTSLVSHILSYCGIKNRVVGNIGVGILKEIYEYGLDYKYVVEVSSFQLASSKSFRARMAAITNISPDHIDWHGSYHNYVEAKKRLALNLLDGDFLFLNHDDPILRDLEIDKKINVTYISTEKKLDEGYYLFDDKIYRGNEYLFDRKIIGLVGNHNVSNSLFAIAIVRSLGLSFGKIKSAIETFTAIEHRIEPVKKINGVVYYNDSKGTNVDSTEKALNGFKDRIILIAGGYDKKSSYDKLFVDSKKIKLLILMGATKEKIMQDAQKMGIENIALVKDLEEATRLAYNKATKGDTVLLSPACASWGMYNNYEERGRHFKKIVNGIYEENKEENK